MFKQKAELKAFSSVTFLLFICQDCAMLTGFTEDTDIVISCYKCILSLYETKIITPNDVTHYMYSVVISIKTQTVLCFASFCFVSFKCLKGFFVGFQPK